MLRLGITGGIGSGKSVVCSIFNTLGVPVYNADTRAKFLVNSVASLQSDIKKFFGPKSFEDGVYNRKYISALVFGNTEKRLQLNRIIHPYVLNDWDEFCEQNKDRSYIVKEAAIMLETDSKKSIDRIVLVYSPLELRIERIMKRDDLDRETILKRMEAQMPEEEKLELADEVIYNDSKHSLIEQVLKIHKRLNA